MKGDSSFHLEAMRHNTHDKTLYRNYVRKWKFLIEYDWSNRNGIPRSGLSPISTDFIRPTGRPSSSITTGSARAEPSTHWCLSHAARSRRVYGYIEQQGCMGVNRYEICQILAPKLKHLTPSPSTVYRTQRYGLNRFTPKLREEKRRIGSRKPEN